MRAAMFDSLNSNMYYHVPQLSYSHFSVFRISVF